MYSCTYSAGTKKEENKSTVVVVACLCTSNPLNPKATGLKGMLSLKILKISQFFTAKNSKNRKKCLACSFTAVFELILCDRLFHQKINQI